MTTSDISDKIPLVADRVIDMERYRSGHNEAVLKTVCPRGRVGSNPTLSALKRGAGNSVKEFPALCCIFP